MDPTKESGGTSSSQLTRVHRSRESAERTHKTEMHDACMTKGPPCRLVDYFPYKYILVLLDGYGCDKFILLVQGALS